jgi:glucosamine-6-phosphate deaminase
LTDSYEALSLELAEAIGEQLKTTPSSAFGLPTGRSPLGCYEILAAWSRDGRLDWSQARCFALDEYLDCEDESMSFQHFLLTNLYQYTNLSPANCFNPKNEDDYDALIARHGGLDLTVLGIGTNGHIAFNEPGTPERSWTHSIWLTESTRKANQSYLKNGGTVPDRAVTMGISTILASKKLILIASGEGKRGILKKALLGAVTPEIPASFLSLHPHVTVLTDFDLDDEGQSQARN